MHEVGEVIQRVGIGNQVEFSETEAGASGGVQEGAVFFDDGQSLEIFDIREKRRVGAPETDDLHVGVAHGAAGQVTVVLEEDDGAVFSAGFHFQPFRDAETGDTAHVLDGVIGHIDAAAVCLD